MQTHSSLRAVSAGAVTVALLSACFAACSSSSSIGHSDADDGRIDAGIDAEAKGVTVSACTKCTKDELCVAAYFDGECDEDAGCGIDATTTYECFPLPSACASGITCACAVGPVTAACSYDTTPGDTCTTVTAGVVNCNVSHD